MNGTVITETEDFRLPGGVAGRRRLAGFLAKAGEELVSINGQYLSKQEALGHMLWALLLNGEVNFPDGRLLFIDEIEQWTAIAKFVYSHLDGPAATTGDTRATNAVVRVVFGSEEFSPTPVES